MINLKSRQSEDEDPQINMTPLLDVLFVLLMLFILIAPFLQIDRVQLVPTLKEAKNLQTANFETRSELIIEVDEKDRLSLNNKMIDVAMLESELALLKINPEKIVPLLLEDKKSSFGTFETIKQVLEKSGYKQLDVVLKSQ